MTEKIFVVTIKVLGMKEVPLHDVKFEKISKSTQELDKKDVSALPCPHCQESIEIHLKMVPDAVPDLPVKIEKDESDDDFGHFSGSIFCEPIEPEIETKEEVEADVSDCSSIPQLDSPPPIKRRKTRTSLRSAGKETRKETDSPSKPTPTPKIRKSAQRQFDKSLVCPDCGRTYNRRDSLYSHYYVHHRKADTRIVCPQCGISILEGALNRHIRHIHGPSRYECHLCNAKFRAKFQIQKHILETHKSEFSYKCDVENCGRLFKSHSALRSHLSTVKHTPNRPRPYTCPRCPKTFYQKLNRDEHVLTHDGVLRHSCEVCEAKFLRKGGLKAHMQVHYPNRQFACSFNCGKRFVRKNALQVHERIHTGERDFLCNYPGCTSRFYEHGTLRQHKLFHVKRDKGLTNMRLPDVARLYFRQRKHFWEEGYPRSDEEMK